MNSRQGGEARERLTPPSAQTVVVVPLPPGLPPGVVQQLSPTVRMALHASRGLAPAGGHISPRPSPPRAAGAAQLRLWGPHFYKPKGCAFGSQIHSMLLPGLVLWTKRGMASLYISTTPKGAVAFNLCTEAASAFAISICNLLVSREQLLR